MFAMNGLGYSSYWMEVTGNGGTALTDAVMNIKYYIEKFSAREPVIYRDKNYSIYESEYLSSARHSDRQRSVTMYGAA